MFWWLFLIYSFTEGKNLPSVNTVEAYGSNLLKHKSSKYPEEAAVQYVSMCRP